MLEKIKELENNTKVKLKDYKRKNIEYTLFLEKMMSWVDNKEYYYLTLRDSENNTYLFDRKLNLNTYDYIYSIYNIYNDKSKFVKSNYIKKVMDFIEEYNKQIRREING